MESRTDRLHALMSPPRAARSLIPISRSTPSLVSVSKAPGEEGSALPTPPTSPPISETEKRTSQPSGVSEQTPMRRMNESRVTRRSNSRIQGCRSVTSLALPRGGSAGGFPSQKGSIGEEGGQAPLNSTSKYGSCSFGEQLRPIEVCIPVRPRARNASVRRQASMAKVMDVSSPSSVADMELLWGLRVRTYSENVEGTTYMTVQIQGVTNDGPAEKQGIQLHDQILSINGESVKALTTPDVMRLLGEKGHDQLKLTILPYSQTVITNAQIFGPSRATIDILWCVRNQLTTLSLWDIDMSSKAKTPVRVDFSRLILISDLSVCGCKLDSLDPLDSLDQLHFLSHVRLSNNQLTAGALDGDCSLSMINGIRSLVLNQNRIEYFPACIYKLPKLEHINLAYNQLHEVPRAINVLEYLTHLNLDGNALLEVEPALFCTHSLKFLSITRNSIEDSPFLERQGLVGFALDGNPFTSKPLMLGSRREIRDSLRTTSPWRKRQSDRADSPKQQPQLAT